MSSQMRPPRTSPRSGPQARRSPIMVIAGIVLVIAGALTSIGVYSNLSQTQEVVAIIAPVARGEQIERTDLTTVQVGFDPLLTPVPGDQINQIVGLYAVADLVPGTFLSPDAVGARVSPTQGLAEIGVALAAGEYPDDTLLPGDAVLLVALPDRQDVLTTVTSYPATLVRITQPNASNLITVSVMVSAADAPLLAALSASERLALVLASREH